MLILAWQSTKIDFIGIFGSSVNEKGISNKEKKNWPEEETLARNKSGTDFDNGIIK
jgi:hypothetical protein